jgi:hypothetical protein
MSYQSPAQTKPTATATLSQARHGRGQGGAKTHRLHCAALGVAGLLWAVVAQAALPGTLPSPMATTATPNATVRADQLWDDTPWAALQRQSGVAPTAEARHAQLQAWLAWHTAQLRADLAQTLWQAARQEQAGWMDSEPSAERDAALGAAGQRVALFEAQMAERGLSAAQTLQQLANLTGVPATALHRALAEWLAQAHLPLTAEQLPPAVLQAQVPQPLADFGEAARQLAAGQRWVATRRAEWQAKLQRQQLGSNEAADTLQAYQQFLLDSDTLVLNSGRLASAWAYWLFEQQQAAATAGVRTGAGGSAQAAGR